MKLLSEIDIPFQWRPLYCMRIQKHAIPLLEY
jgi:hypothetical protein